MFVLWFGGLDHIVILPIDGPAAGLDGLPAHIILANFCQTRVSSALWAP